MPDGIAALFWGIITFSLLIVIHEGGHFLAARLFGVKVHEFMIGLPGPAIRFHAKKTTYGITAIPLGGYVRIAGMEPGPENPLLGPALAVLTAEGPMDAQRLAPIIGVSIDEADQALLTLADWDAVRAMPGSPDVYASRFAPELAHDQAALLDGARAVTYRGLSMSRRLVVLAAGVVFNLVTAVLVFTVVLSAFGYYEINDRIGGVESGSAAQRAGIVPGDRIVKIAGETVVDWDSLVTAVSHNRPGDTVSIELVRDAKPITVTAVLQARPRTNQALLGVTPGSDHIRPGVGRSLAMSFTYIGLTAEAIARLFNPATFRQTVDQSSSVIGASYMAASAAESGPIDYASLIAMLSLSLGVINLVPIPPLDGGKVVLEIVERIRRRPLPRSVYLGLSGVGTLLLLTLIAYLMYSDVVRFIVR